jgi:hypothetical protein
MLPHKEIEQCRDVTYSLEFTALVTRAGPDPAYFGIKNVPVPVVKITGHHSRAGLPPTESICERLRDVIEP